MVIIWSSLFSSVCTQCQTLSKRRTDGRTDRRRV